MTHLMQSVRVRITLAATLVTAVAVALAGWLLIRSVHDNRLDEVRDRAEAQADQVKELIERGVPAEQAVRMVDLAGPVEVHDEDAEIVAAFPPGRCTEGTTARCDFLISGSTSKAAPGTAVTGGSTDPQVIPPEACLVDPTLCPSVNLGLGDSGAGGSGSSNGSDAERQPAPAAGVVVFQQRLEPISRTAHTSAGDFAVIVGAPVSEVAEAVAAIRASLWILLPGLVGIVAIVAWWLAGRALRPVEAIRAEAEAIGGSTIYRRVPEPATGDEIGRLARTMNAMLERLDHSARRQRQFVSDASHELRSPLAAIRTDLEVALREGGEADWSGVATAVLDEELRLETLLADLLVLAADDEGAGSATLRYKPVDLQELVSEETARHEIASAPQAEPVVVAGVAAQLRRALGNLVTNAERHARSRVEVAIERVDDRARVTVDDDGPGIPPPDRERVFERFARLDDGRTRDQGGAGLGLAVVRSIVVRHSGRVWADDSPLGGARFTIDLPASR